jgi:7-cyano-7-deazaguanine synthase
MKDSIAVLSSGGLDSCVLLADMARHAKVYPIYVRGGLFWEKEEFKALHSFIHAVNNPNIQPITSLSLSVESLFKNNWSMNGHGIPSQYDPDSKTYQSGRNVLLLSPAAVWCSLHQVPRIVIGSLKGNPFPDATIDFFRQFGETLSVGLAFQIRIDAPYREKYKKEDLIREYHTLPLELSLTCMDPREGKHCGQCNKCAERQVGYKAAGIPDRTKYATNLK